MKANTRKESEIIKIVQFYFQGRRNSLLSAIDQLLVLKVGLQKSDWFYRHEIGNSSESKNSNENDKRGCVLRMIIWPAFRMVHAAWGSIESTTILTTHPGLETRNLEFENLPRMQVC